MIAAASVALSMLVATPALAAKGRLKPEEAQEQRSAIEGRTLSMDARAAVDELERAGQENGDPELFLSAAERAYDEAATSRNPILATRAEDLALTARDIGLYLSDEGNYSATSWRPITSERAGALASEAGALAGRARALAAEIEAEIAAAAAAANVEEPVETKRELRPGTGLIIGGSVALVIGAGGVGMFSAGMALGAAAQRDAEALAEGELLPSELAELEEIDRRGATANTIAIAGGAVAGVGIIVGAALIAVGVKKRRAAGPPEDARLSPRPQVMVNGWFDRGGGGLSLRGSF